MEGLTSVNETSRVEEPRNEGAETENFEVRTPLNDAGLFRNIGDAMLEDKRRTICLSHEDVTASGNLVVTAANKQSSSEPTGVSVVDDLPGTTEGTAMALQDDHGEENRFHRPSTPGEVSVPPQIIPLPFSLPRPCIDDASSMVVSAASDYFPPCKKKRLSVASLCRTLSKRSRHSQLASASEEALAVPQELDDRRSTSSGTASVNSLQSDHKEEDQTTAGERSNVRSSIKRKAVPSPASPRSHCSLHAIDVGEALSQSLSDGATQSLGLAKSVVPSEPFSGRVPPTNLSEHLPEGGSPLVITYRTNEWAKHLDRAEKPGLDELESSVDELRPGNEQVEEIPAPVDVEGLRQTSGVPLTPRRSSQPGLSGRLQQCSTDGTPFMMSNDSLPNLCNLRTNANPSVSAYSQSPGRSPSQMSLHSPRTWNGLSYQASMKSTTQQPTILITQACRGASAPLNGQALVESPIGEGVETSLPPRLISDMPKNTLMAKRDTFLRNRYSYVTLTHQPLSAAGHAAEIMPIDSASVHSTLASSLDDDNIPLSQRRSLLRQGKRHTSLPQTQAISSHNLPQPLRSSSALTDQERRDHMLASWRNSVRQELSSNTVPQVQSEMDARRTELMNEKYQLGLSRQQKATYASHRDSMIDQAMRRGEMLDVHREAMRKMQAAANKYV